jgi:hypothetical protein
VILGGAFGTFLEQGINKLRIKYKKDYYINYGKPLNIN